MVETGGTDTLNHREFNQYMDSRERHNQSDFMRELRFKNYVDRCRFVTLTNAAMEHEMAALEFLGSEKVLGYKVCNPQAKW